MKEKLYSFLHVKEFDDEKREFRGMATTPEVDRQGDIVEPSGAKFKNPIPLLLRHDHSQPVGTVELGKPTKDGIPFVAKIPRIESPAGLKGRVDEAWESVKSGIMRAVSIGFRGLEWSIIEETGGIRFTKSEIVELSLVSVGANSTATIQQIKALDRQSIASTGRNMGGEKSLKASENAEKKTKTVKISTLKKENEMKISEQLKQFRDTLAEKQAKLVDLGEKSADETFDAAAQEEFDTLAAEVEEVKGHIKRLEVAEKAAMATAKPVTEKAGQNEDSASKARQGVVSSVKNVAEAVPGLGFARIAKTIALSHANRMPVIEMAQKLYPDDKRIVKAFEEKTAVAAGTTSNSTWAKPLVGAESDVYADFAEFLRPATILGKFGQGSVPSLRTVPFRTRLLGQTSGGAANWVGEGNAKPLTKFDFAGTTLEPLKIAAIAVITKELLEDSSPSAETLVRDGLRDALVAKLDNDFIAPSVTANAGINPASITNAATPIPSSGDDAEAVRCDIRALLAGFIAQNNPPSTAVFVMPTLTALALSQMQNPLGQTEFPGIGMTGGILLGFPVIVSDYMPAGYVALVNAGDVYYGDGAITVDMSDQASLQMDDTPDNPTTASTVLVSLWQRNLVGFLVEKRVNYKLRRTGSVQVLSGVAWGACAS